MTKVFKYKNPRVARPEYSPSGINRVGVTENLTGTVQGKSASDLEERMSRAFDKLKLNYEFRARISSLAVGSRHLTQVRANLPGELEVDHLLDNGQIVPILIDGQISHYMSPSQRLEDEAKTDAINEFGRSFGWHEVIRIPFTEIKTQEEADHVARRIANGVYIPTGVR